MTAAGIVADDLTGAADSAVQFTRAGWTARLALGGDAPATVDDGSVVAIVTDSRALDPGAAHAVTAASVRDLAAAGAGRVFVKVDSTMRGSVADQVRGALEAWREQHPAAVAVVSPAYPSLGRTVVGGRLLVDGVGVDETAVGRDPVTPVVTAEMADLLPGSTRVAVALDGEGDGDGDEAAAALARRLVAAAASGADVVTVDASTDDELGVVAGAVLLLGPRAVPVGSAGLAVPVSQAWAAPREAAPSRGIRRPGHVVVVLSSLHDASRSQADHLVAATTGARVVAPTLGEVLAGDLGPALARARAVEDGDVTVVLAPARGDDAGPEGEAGGTVAERVADALATLTERVVADHEDVALVLVGGEGARAVLRRVGADAVLVRGALREGVPWGTLEGGRLHGTPVVTKAGGFGPATTLADAVTDLLDHHHRPAPQGEPS
ncbi:four-carbon acid sugar kinase family protein [Frigoribacterium salinisoli]